MQYIEYWTRKTQDPVIATPHFDQSESVLRVKEEAWLSDDTETKTNGQYYVYILSF